MTESQDDTAVNSTSSLDPELGLSGANKNTTTENNNNRVNNSADNVAPSSDDSSGPAPAGKEKDDDIEEDNNGESSHAGADNAETGSHLQRYISEAEKPRTHSDDPNVIDWDGDDDPDNPRNWPMKRKIRNILIVSMMVFVVPLASSMFAPGVEQVMLEFKSTSETLAAFVVSVFVLGFAFGPVLLAPLSEVYGRLHLYWICDLLFFVFSICCAKSKSMGELIAFRFLCGFFGGLPMAVGGGTITDMMTQDERGFAMAIFGMGPMMGPVAGPIIGGFLSQAKGWRWVFWLLAILGGVCAIATFVLMDETYAPVILQKRVDRLKKERGNPDLRSALDDGLSRRTAVWHSLHRPLKLLLFVPVVTGLATFQAFCFGCLYLIFTTFTMVYQDVYHWSVGLQGLAFIPMGCGAIFGTLIFGSTSDRILEWKARTKGHGVLKPEYRLYLMMPTSLGIPIGLFWYGWAAQEHTHWIVPILGTFFIGIGFFFAMVTIISYVMDAFTEYSASAVSAVAVLRSLFGGLLPLAGREMYSKMGYGWGSSLLGFVSLALVPVPFLFYARGEYLRKKYPVHLE